MISTDSKATGWLRLCRVLLAAAVTCLAMPAAWSKTATDAWQPASTYLAQRRPSYTGMVRSSFYLTMRDGVKIAVDLYLPRGLQPGEKLPAIIRQTRYYRSHDLGPLLRVLTRHWPSAEKLFVPRGYAWVSVDVRGTGASFGRWAYSWSPDEIRDGAEVVDWIIRQPWSNGKVGSMGISYDGGCAEFLLVSQHPAVKASAPEFTLFDAYQDVAYPGGISLGSFTNAWGSLNRALDNGSLATITHLMPRIVRSSYHGVRPVDRDRARAMLAEAIREHAKNLDVKAMAPQVTFRDDVPAPPGVPIDASSPFTYAPQIEASGAALYVVEGWFDAGFENGAIKRYLTLKNHGRLVIGPWNHGGFNNASPFSRSWKAGFNIDAELLRFFDYQLKGVNNGIADEKNIKYFTMGEEKWKTTDVWPPPGVQTLSFYLGPARKLARDKPDAGAASDAYLVDRTAGTTLNSRWDLGALVNYGDRRTADARLLCYTSSPLDRNTEVTGHPVVTLYVSSTADDGEFFAYLEDVSPRGRVTYVTEGELRAIDRKISKGPPPYPQTGPYHSFRRGDRMPLVAGKVATFEILPTSYVFEQGHSIRLAFAGADKDHFTILPGPAPTWRVRRDVAYPSHIDLPVIPQ